jgi:hypothetical protein
MKKNDVFCSLLCNSIAILSKQLIFNYYATPLSLHHDVMLMSLIVIHLFKSDTWHNKKLAHGILIKIWNK